MRWLLLLTSLACAKPPATIEPAAAPVWSRVQAAPPDAALEGPALVLADTTSRSVVTPPFRATVMKLHVQPGDTVKAGAAVVTVVMPEVLEAAGRAEGARARVAAWEARHQQLKALHADGLARTLDVSDAAVQEATARAELQAARAVLLAAQVRDAAALLAGQGVIELRAPSSGVITSIEVTPGESREPSAGPLVSIAGPGASRVEARLPRAAEDGDWRFVTGSLTVPLRLLSRAPAVDARDGSVMAWFEFSEQPAPPPGTAGRVVSGETASTAFLVDATAITRDGSQARVKTRAGFVPIDVRRCDGELCVVTGALRAGDEVEQR